MLSRPQLIRHRMLLSQIHAAKSKKTVTKVIQECNLIQLRLLIKLIYDVMLNKISLTIKKQLKKLFRYKNEIRAITASVKDVLKREETVLRGLIAQVIPVLNVFVSPLFHSLTDNRVTVEPTDEQGPESREVDPSNGSPLLTQ